MELSIDTSTRYASVALSRNGEVFSELSWNAGQSHSTQLVPTVRGLMQQAGVDIAGTEAVFVARGPGGFSALRVGLSVAKSVAMARGVPLVGVSTLDIEAQPHLERHAPVCALIDAGRRLVYTATYRDRTARLSETEYGVEGYEELTDSADAKTLYCGEGLASVAGLLREKVGDGVLLAESRPPTRSPAVLARLGHKRLQANDIDDLEALKPIYIRGSQFEVTSLNKRTS